jgi:hypothetical protein
VIRVADHMAGTQLPAEADQKPVTANIGLARNAVSVPVCQSSTVIAIDERYQESVGLLNMVRLHSQGFLKL